jgi:hypothetical protein
MDSITIRRIKKRRAFAAERGINQAHSGDTRGAINRVIITGQRVQIRRR